MNLEGGKWGTTEYTPVLVHQIDAVSNDSDFRVLSVFRSLDFHILNQVALLVGLDPRGWACLREGRYE